MAGEQSLYGGVPCSALKVCHATHDVLGTAVTRTLGMVMYGPTRDLRGEPARHRFPVSTDQGREHETSNAAVRARRARWCAGDPGPPGDCGPAAVRQPSRRRQPDRAVRTEQAERAR